MNNTVIFSCGNDFAAGTLENLIPAPHIGRGALVLADGALEGSFVSPVMSMDDFSMAVMSWNTDVSICMTPGISFSSGRKTCPFWNAL